MSDRLPNSEFSLNRFIENADELRTANNINDQQMERLFNDLFAKTQEYRHRWMMSEARNNSMKTVMAKQLQYIARLHEKLHKMSGDLQTAKMDAQRYARKYNTIMGKLKTVISESTADADELQANGQ